MKTKLYELTTSSFNTFETSKIVFNIVESMCTSSYDYVDERIFEVNDFDDFASVILRKDGCDTYRPVALLHLFGELLATEGLDPEKFSRSLVVKVVIARHEDHEGFSVSREIWVLRPSSNMLSSAAFCDSSQVFTDQFKQYLFDSLAESLGMHQAYSDPALDHLWFQGELLVLGGSLG